MFTGRRVDILDNGSLKIQYNRNRYYDYYTGRWTTQDPLGNVDGMSLYEYGRSNSITIADPLGLFGISTDIRERISDLVSRQLPKTSLNVTLWSSKERTIVLSVSAYAVKACPKECPCADISMLVSYTTYAKSEVDKKVPWEIWREINPRITLAGTRLIAPIRIPGRGVSIAVQQRLLGSALRRLPAIHIRDLLGRGKRSWSVSGGLNEARVCLNTCEEKLFADVCRFSGSFSGQIGSTKRSPLNIPISVGVTASVVLNWDVCHGTLEGRTRGVGNVSIDLPDPFNVTTDALDLWDFTFLSTSGAPRLWERASTAGLCGD